MNANAMIPIALFAAWVLASLAVPAMVRSHAPKRRPSTAAATSGMRQRPSLRTTQTATLSASIKDLT